MISSLLLDRDGTLIEDKHYLADPEGVVLLSGVGEALAILASQSIRFFVVSNQSGIGRGYFSARDVDLCNTRLAQLLKPYGVVIEQFLSCPHSPEAQCVCRKPALGMWNTLQSQYLLEAAHTVMVGDKPADLLFATNAMLLGSILTLQGKGRITAEKLDITYDDTPFTGFPDESRAGYPKAVIHDFHSLVSALAFLQQVAS